LTAQHVSSDIISHHQELLNSNYSFCFTHVCRCRPSGRQRQTWVKQKL